MAVGPTAIIDDSITLNTYNVAIVPGSADVAISTIFNNGQARKVTPGSTGTLYLQGANDAAMVKWSVVAGFPVLGRFIAVGGTVTGTTITSLVVSA